METTWICCTVVILDVDLVYELFLFFGFPSIPHSHDNITLTDVSHTKVFHFAAQYHLTSSAQLRFFFALQIRSLITDISGNKLLILSGQSSEQGGDILLQGGALTWQHFSDIILNPQVSRACLLSKKLSTVCLY